MSSPAWFYIFKKYICPHQLVFNLMNMYVLTSMLSSLKNDICPDQHVFHLKNVLTSMFFLGCHAMPPIGRFAIT
jgi:4-hydroxybenzoate polyprenyltransferase